ncbi:MAG TPA: hypothetical protein H9667_11885 [Firmicutes bacterium]|nr:hypothetical protein [Bacillales bacterium]HJA42188.1 hypothetical protein [Bacillota bacterium]
MNPDYNVSIGMPQATDTRFLPFIGGFALGGLAGYGFGSGGYGGYSYPYYGGYMPYGYPYYYGWY